MKFVILAAESRETRRKKSNTKPGGGKRIEENDLRSKTRAKDRNF